MFRPELNMPLVKLLRYTKFNVICRSLGIRADFPLGLGNI